jgi:5-methylcytosine-specific restriction endonuclease McrA
MKMYELPKRRKLTKAERQTVYDKCASRCAYCGCEISMKQMQADHVIPMEFYDAYKAIGQDIDTIENMLPACRSCNNYKSTLMLEKFRTAIERWPTVLNRDSVTYRNSVRFGMIEPKPHKVVFYFEKLREE